MSENPHSHSKHEIISIREMIGLFEPEVWKKIIVWGFVSILTTGLPASFESALSQFVSDSIALGFDELFAQTAPLIWSVILVSFACHRGWLDEAGLIPSAALILFGGWLGHAFQHGAVVAAVEWLPSDRFGLLGSVVFAALNLMIAYLISYGIGAFLASILVGSVIGVGWSKGAYKLQRKFSEDVSEKILTVPDQQDQQRRAA
ncbi:hypothetical protein [Thalassoglobus sp.]|uniref:hypothetical protein n=1 Tax=Thalassoglobus sp. TaxID=2795869 RepID=UPI003AA7C549